MIAMNEELEKKLKEEGINAAVYYNVPLMKFNVVIDTTEHDKKLREQFMNETKMFVDGHSLNLGLVKGAREFIKFANDNEWYLCDAGDNEITEKEFEELIEDFIKEQKENGNDK